jgi:hypothetical protein
VNHQAGDIHASQYDRAARLFRAALFEGRFMRLVKRLLCHRTRLFDLAEFKPRDGSFYAGLMVVDIARIVGTEGRTADFDLDFFPVKEDSRQRWINIALLHLSCCPIVQPVDLIQVGEKYFVRDGHHRISVARALGQTAIDAEVTVWNVDTPLSQPDQRVLLQPVRLTH